VDKLFREMRRKDREMSPAENAEILKKCLYGVMSTIGEGGYAYGVPLNYEYLNNSIYFHCADCGQKLDNIKNNDRVSFCVVGDIKPLPDKFSMMYESVILFGRASEVFDDEKDKALLALIKKYSIQ
jgi:nitroimidazol reductase NimA-like FMN-containing flavoprotein (pyridoxamine 5'-phosphate oxidase superfamily)